MIGHLSGEMMLIKCEPPIAASFESDVSWHFSMLSLGADVTGGTLERSKPVVVRHGYSEAAGLQMRHNSVSDPTTGTQK
jgi:hypothetical protein